MQGTHRSSSPRTIRVNFFALCYSLIVTTAFLPLSPFVMVTGAKSNESAVTSSSNRFVQPAGILGAPQKLLAPLLPEGGGLPGVSGPNRLIRNAAPQIQPIRA
jgi:hypothetical protein